MRLFSDSVFDFSKLSTSAVSVCRDTKCEMTSFIKASASFLDDMDDISGFLGICLCSLIIMRSGPSWNVGVLLAPSHFSRVVMGQNFGRISSLRKELAILNLSSILSNLEQTCS